MESIPQLLDCNPVVKGNHSTVYHVSNNGLQSNVTTTVYLMPGVDHSNVTTSDDSGQAYLTRDIEHFLYSKVLIAICALGILGNVLNVLVLTRKRLQKTMDRMEKSVHAGLIALAASDMVFCLLLLPHAWIEKPKGFYFLSRGFALFYKAYSDGVINIFIMSSTWLTVIMATSRYLAICHPLRAREIIGMTFAKASVAVVFLLCIIFNLPKFWREEINHIECEEGYVVYFRDKGFLQRYPVFDRIYLWVYFSVGILIPIIVLAFCNLHLIKALKHSSEMRQRYNPTTVHVEGAHRFTLTLVVIVVMYILLVTPAEMVNFVKDIAINDTSLTDTHNLIVAIANILQAINFAFNYVLYCIVNVHFRRTMKGMFCDQFKDASLEAPPGERARYDSLTATTGLLVTSVNNKNHIALAEF